MEIMFKPTRASLENKTTINSIDVWEFLSHEIYMKNNWYVWEIKILPATKLTILSQNLWCK